jgi:uncharacterized membrane protein YphA (DoxX/SURF4 family)
MLTALNDALPRPRWMALSADSIFRGLVGLAVIGAGVGRLTQSGEPVTQLTGASLMVLGGSLAAGLWTRLSALLLAVIWSVTILPGAVATIFASDPLAPRLEGFAILGALYFIYVRGGGQVSVDGARRKRAPVAKPSSRGRAISRL